jgi:Cu/Ag efflux pump CusA
MTTILPAGVTLQRRIFTAADVGAVVATPADDGPRSLAETIEQTVGKLLRLPGVRSAWRLDLPGNAVSFDGLERAKLLIEIQPRFAGDRQELLDGIRAAFAPTRSLASLGTAVAEPGQFPGVLGELTAVLSGSDLEIMRREAEGVRERFAELPGVVDLQLEPPEPGLSFRFKARDEDAKRYGLDAADALKLATAVAYRLPLTRISGPAGRPIDVVTVLENAAPAELASLILSTPEGVQVPLDRIVVIEATDVPQIIFRLNGRRATVIACNGRNHDPAATRESLKKLCRTLPLPKGYSLRCCDE